MSVNRTREVLSFELGKEIEKDVFVLSRTWNMRNRISDFPIPRPDALSRTESLYEVHITKFI